ncbi:LysR substrate-binding domain-containing protein [Variovorax soli]|uniref:LysR substrate-binding domain-containing protein n=1 Tax=Variovorax soli TaxID=376815 RepID=UPI0008396064|nr:LysR substrate-binding domain-containing protein [Variovorax soli]
MNPRRLTPSMSLLMAFDASARHLSFTRAASELCLSQSVVSRQVQALEDLLEVPLFRRQGRQIELTDLGKAYHAEVGSALQRIRSASLQAISFRAGGGSFHLAALPTFAAKWLIPRIRAFYAENPNVYVHVHSRIGRFDAASAGIDAVIGVGDANWPGMRAYHLMDETVIPVVTPDVHERLRAPEDLQDHLLLQVASRPDLWSRWFAHQGIEAGRMRLGPQFELTSHLVQAIVARIGVGLLPDFLVADELRTGILKRTFGLPFVTGYAYYLYVPEDKVGLPPIAAFIDWVSAAIQSAECGPAPALDDKKKKKASAK